MLARAFERPPRARKDILNVESLFVPLKLVSKAMLHHVDDCLVIVPRVVYCFVGGVFNCA